MGWQSVIRSVRTWENTKRDTQLSTITTKTAFRLLLCETYKAAEEYIGEKIRHDWLIGNCYDYGIVDLEIGIAPEREAVPQGDAMSACTGCV